MEGEQTRGTILIIDDDPQLGPFLRELLESERFLVMLASDGIQGQRLFDNRRPDLVLTDLIMPGREGIELIMGLRQANGSLPIIAMSGGSRFSGRYLDIAQTLGANAILRKPFSADQLLATIESLLPTSIAE